MMISETAAESGGPAAPMAQAAYLNELAAALSPPSMAAAPMAAPATNPSAQFPLIRAVSYFDAPGRFQQNAYAFDAEGLSAFQSLSKLPYFLPPQQQSTTSMTISQTPTRTATRVQLTANINADNGGTVSFSDNGSPIAACQNVPLVSGATCTTTSMPAGSTGSIQATYSGDAAFMPSTSDPDAVAVMAWSGSPPKAPGKPSRGDTGGSDLGGATSEGMAGPVVAASSTPFPAFSGSPTIGSLAGTRFPQVTSPASSSVAASTATPLYASDNGLAVDPVAAARPGNSWQGLAILAALALIASLMAYIAFSWSRDRRRPQPGRPTER
jgi:Bacterial Ig-like domain (group 3)